ncbi:MAG: VPLPA-CTERM sorting domain-containing protein [Oceanicoccus sp.]|uniref:VPLPA-CTERM sorting domain-containing protein n=1 Tax=Oceanicoccus sp. TaxID=2691044 RepID=UPI002626B5B3|nr:VPLPA-CTERM sorting domain-containing protein [Oceanicoccus sp.]MDG1773238.1 VPLPA-CTERM sorting domain-containing protein [Oceanicoccus sp.]
MNPTSPCYAYDGSCDMGFNNTTGELGHMFYNNLGNLGRYDTNGNFQSGYGVTNSSFTDGNSGASVSIVNLQNSRYYWDGVGYAPTNLHARAFYTYRGSQEVDLKDGSRYSWAVRAGDVSSVPVPAAAWLFGTALLGLVGVKRKNQNL